MTRPPDTDSAAEPDPVARARQSTEFFALLVPGQMGCIFDHSAADLVLGHIDVTPNLIAGTDRPQNIGAVRFPRHRRLIQNRSGDFEEVHGGEGSEVRGQSRLC